MNELDPQEEQPKKLSPKHQEFVNNYFRLNMNATDAYQTTYPKSSYDAARAHGARLVADGNIQAEIQRRLKERAMSADEVIARLSDMARASIKDFAGIRNANDLTDIDNGHLIKKLERTITTDQLGRQREKIKIELYDAQAALKLVGENNGALGKGVGSEDNPFTVKLVNLDPLLKKVWGDNEDN